MRTDPRLFEYYESLFEERERLARREGQLELARTQELLLRFLPEPPASVIDIGGGTGIYTAWLASLGYEVHLVDVVPGHVEAAAEAGTFTAAVGDARSLPDPDEAYDAALLCGPLYHLRDREDRLLALREARRVVRPGGLVVAAFISRSAVALDGYVKGWLDGSFALENLKRILRQGLVEVDRKGFSVVAYFHLPSEARSEVETGDLDVTGVFGVEGPGWIASDFEERWSTEAGREIVLESARACEETLELIGLSAHILILARRAFASAKVV